jgi:hypothetical protein
MKIHDLIRLRLDAMHFIIVVIHNWRGNEET